MGIILSWGVYWSLLLLLGNYQMVIGWVSGLGRLGLGVQGLRLYQPPPEPRPTKTSCSGLKCREKEAIAVAAWWFVAMRTQP